MASSSDGRVDNEEHAFRRIVHRHVERYPRLQMQDLYKLVHQAAMGSEHAVGDTAAVRRWLVGELADLPPGPQEPIIDTISVDGKLVRVNLRPFVSAGGNSEALLSAFIRTANEMPGSFGQLKRYWSYVEVMAEAGELAFQRDELAAFLAEKERQGFPAAHHSKTYVELYKPAYRVVLLEFLSAQPIAY